ncbi:MAG: uracil-DNA glycosylase [Methylobacillus sp.]|jgi:uracil-DNA glycosylase|nr:uracil-DNA glycosylase [Methylobacillus sp.]
MMNGEVKIEQIPSAWNVVVPGLDTLYARIAEQLAEETDARPGRGLWFEALRRVSPEQTRVVLLGQDPYHGEDRGIQQAHGLAFSVPDGVRPPPSLRNILKEMESDLGRAPSPISGGNLGVWADQGVLLLNASLTTRGGVAGAHVKHWQPFTQKLIAYLGQRRDTLVFILWGGHAQKHKVNIAPHHVIIESAHPSPLSAWQGFFGSRPFSRTNAALAQLGKAPVNW